MNHISKNERYCHWPEEDSGAYALRVCQDLLRHLLSGWPRRSRSVLTLGAGSCALVETLWDAGFDVTAQDDNRECLDRARALLGSRADFVLSAPDHLPYDDDAFDYAVATLALEFWEDPEAVLTEMNRLATRGVVLLFPNAWSLFGLECHIRRGNRLCRSARPLLHSPRQLYYMANRVFDGKRRAWASVLPLPSGFWRQGFFFRRINTLYMPFPLGAFAGLRIDFGPTFSGTPLLVKHSQPVADIKP